ncbi:MAG: hypothetical protein FWG20_02195 [Candidatus Cloacimonetes bacterium]|nr:hypothetical protein [Candidatus Cloacimonadota bacterium]
MSVKRMIFGFSMVLLLLLITGCEIYKVHISPKSADADRGDTVQFTAEVKGGEGTQQGVNWSVSGGVQGTSISSSGRLTISDAESAEKLTVKASSIHHKVSETARVNVKNRLGVTHVIISPATVNINRGDSVQLTATVYGYYNFTQNVNWSITGANEGTTISQTGLLTIGANETSRTLVVTATSAHSSGISADAQIAIGNAVTNFSVTDTDSWVVAMRGIRDGGNYRFYNINLNGNVALPVPAGHNFGTNIGICVTIAGSGTMELSASGSLIQLGNRQTLIVRNISMIGRAGNNAPLILLESGSKFYMESDARIKDNHTSAYAGGVVVNDGAEFVLDASSIVENSSSSFSGAVYVNGGSFVMRGGANITSNSSSGYSGLGGVCVNNKGSFTMENGSITGNNSSRHAGGVYVGSRSLFVMLSGSISSNVASNGNGGGVYINSDYNAWGNFVLHDGIISGNTARDGDGGGIYIGSNAVFTKGRGTITGHDLPAPTGNNATNQGDAVYKSGNPNRWRNRTAGPGDPFDHTFFE